MESVFFLSVLVLLTSLSLDAVFLSVGFLIDEVFLSIDFLTDGDFFSSAFTDSFSLFVFGFFKLPVFLADAFDSFLSASFLVLFLRQK